MAEPRRGWLHGLAAAVGAFTFGSGILGLTYGITFWDSVISVLGFLVLGWAVLDYRKYRRGTPESEVGGGRTIE